MTFFYRQICFDIFAKKVMDIFVVYFDERTRYEVLFVGLTLGHCDYLIEGARNDSLQDVHVASYLLFLCLQFGCSASYIFFDVGLARHVLFTSHDGVSFSATCLPIGKNGTIVPLEDIFYNRKPAFFVDFFLGDIWRKYLRECEWPDGVITGKEVVIFLVGFGQGDSVVGVVDVRICF